MRQIGYRIEKQRVELDREVKVVKIVGDYHIFREAIQIYSDDVLSVNGEEIKAGRRINECIGYSLKNGKFDHFLVKLT
jgi:hypothetical protein